MQLPVALHVLRTGDAFIVQRADDLPDQVDVLELGKAHEGIGITDAMDVMIRWFCLLFGNQFSPDDVLDGYPMDRLMHDIAKEAKEPEPLQTATEVEKIPQF